MQPAVCHRKFTGSPRPGSHPALVLNADYRPLSYYPLSLWSWEDAVKAVLSDRVRVVATYESRARSAHQSFELPSVIALRDFVTPQRGVRFTRANIYLRDEYRCQYCNQAFQTNELTFDHVVPRSLGGETSWGNVVAACVACNTLKADKHPNDPGVLRPIRTPRQPTVAELNSIGRKFPVYGHQTWMDFLYWEGDLET